MEERQTPPAPANLDMACRRHLEFLRKHCPDLLPRGPVEPGIPVDPVPVEGDRVTVLLRTAVKDAAAAAAGRRPADEAPSAVVWTDGADSLLVLLDSVAVTTADGVVTVAVDVACDQLAKVTGSGRGHVEVDLAIGTRKRPTGLLAAAPPPRGPAVVVDRWHDALVALAWQALLDTAAALSAATGADTDGSPLLPSRWTATREGIAVGPQGRHPYDRRRPTSRRAGTPG